MDFFILVIGKYDTYSPQILRISGREKPEPTSLVGYCSYF